MSAASAPSPAAAAPIAARLGPVSAVIVTYKEVELTLAAVASLKAQTAEVAEILVVDNDPGHSVRAAMEAAHPDVRLLHADNVGYAPACNLAAARAEGDWLFFLNPDAAAEPDCLARLLAVAAEHPEAGVVTPQVLFPDGKTINAGENQIHLTGVAWCGRFEEPAEDAPPRRAFITTGAAMLVFAPLYARLEGYCDDFFLFYEDPDLCWRAWLAGADVWYVPRARVRHHYTWGTSAQKWFWLERHRLLSVLTNYRVSTLAVLAPLLVGTEAALLVVARKEGWLPEKLRAYRSVWVRREWIRARRRRLEAIRVRPDAAVIAAFQATVDSTQVESDVARRVAPLLRRYRSGAVALVRAIGR